MEPSTNDLKNTADKAGNYAADKAKQAANAVSAQVNKQGLRTEEIYEDVRERAEDALDASVDFVKKYPLYTVAGAAAVGFIAGALIRRMSR